MVWPTAYNSTENNSHVQCIPPQQILSETCHNLLDHRSKLQLFSPSADIRLTAIACTLGLSSTSKDTIEAMINNGMNIAFLSLFSNKKQLLENLRTAVNSLSKKMRIKCPLAIGLDIKSSSIYTGKLCDNKSELLLQEGNTIKLTNDKGFFDMGDANCIYIDYDLSKIIKEGCKIFLDKSRILLICTGIQGSFITCKIQNTDRLGNCKVVNVPDIDYEVISLNGNDEKDLEFAIEEDLDMVLLSFTNDSKTIKKVRDILNKHKSNILIIAKIENKAGVQNIDEIIKESDGILIERSNLIAHLTHSKLHKAQKAIIAKCNRARKPVICAGGVLNSMVDKYIPLESDVLDISHIVTDGADAVLLTAPTAEGINPIKAIQQMSSICKEAEPAFWHRQYYLDISKFCPLGDTLSALAFAAVQASFACMAKAIIVLSSSGKTAQMLSAFKPKCSIIMVTRNIQVSRQSSLFRGIIPLHYSTQEELSDWHKSVADRIKFGVNFGKWKGFIRSGDPIVIITGNREGTGHSSNLEVMYVMKSLNDESCLKVM